jgi:hypothetical protein
MGKMGQFAEGIGAFEPRLPLRCGKAANLSCRANVLRLVLPMAVGDSAHEEPKSARR